MSDVKISALTAATTPLDGTETVPVVQGTTTKKTLLSDIGTYTSGVAPVQSVNGKIGSLTLGLASADFANQGTTHTVLHGNAAGNPSFGAVVLTSEVSGVLPTANGGTGMAFFTVAGPAASAKTFTFPNASSTVLTDHDTITILQGGTGATTASAARTALGLDSLVGRFDMQIAASDETTAITTGTAKVTFRAPRAFTLTEVRGSLTTAGSSGTTVDINVNGSTILSTKLTFDSSERTTTTAAVPAVISSASIADDDEITVDIDAAGTSAAGLKITLRGTLV